MPRPRITVDASSLLTPQTGIGRYTDQLVRALAARDDLDLRLSLSWRPGVAGRMAAIAAEYGSLGMAIAHNPIPNRLLHAAWHAIGWPTADAFSSGDAVFHATNHLAPPPGRTHVVATIHDLTSIRFPEWHTPYQRLVARYLPRSVARSDRLIADSRSTADDLMQLLGVSADRIRVVPLAAAPHFYDPVSPEAMLAARGRYGLTGSYFLFIGTLEPRKNLGSLLLAHQKLSPELRRAHPLVLVGSRGWADERLLTTIDALDDVHWLGRVPDAELPALLAGALAFVYPSYFEGFGLPVLEAMAAGCPVITSDVSSLPEVTGTGPDAAGFAVAPDDVPALASAMRRVAEDEGLRADLKARGLARARTFSWERTAEETRAVYEELS